MVGPRGKSHIRIAVFTILAVHIVLLGALLLQGCKPNESPDASENTSKPPAELIGEWTPPPPPLPSGSSLTQRTAMASIPLTNEDHAPGIPPIDSSEDPPTLPTSPSITVPPPVDPALPASSSNLAETSPPADPGHVEHKVVRGDSFYILARRYSTTTKAIAEANPTVDPRKMQLGQVLLIPKSSPAATSSSSSSAETAASGTTYKVKSGDTLTKIANLHNTSIRELRVANNLTSDRIMVGQTLSIPK